MRSCGVRFALGIALFVPAVVRADEGLDFFEKKIRPLLLEHCSECHGEKKTKGGLRLDSKDGWIKGGDSGPAIIPGKPDESLLIEALRYAGDIQMPPKGKLPDEAIRDFEKWVSLGAPDPRTGTALTRPSGLDLEAGRKHWAYQPVKSVAPPNVKDAASVRNEIDAFLLSALEAKGLTFSPEADRVVLVRRLSFDLVGLPPTPEQIAEFCADESPDAYERLVDRLIASPQFGERWGRHWLDVARFGESLTLRGFLYKEAWRYRDYVIDAFNADRPYDQFVREQIAGDLLPAEALKDKQRQLIATGFLVLGNHNLEEQDKKQLVMDVVDEQLDVISKGLLAQTVTCARCHDHKFDPIPTRDYYALAGILKNSKSLEHANVDKWMEVPLPVAPDEEAVYQKHEQSVAVLKTTIKTLRESLAKTATKPSGPAILPLKDLPGIVVDDSQAKKVGEWTASRYSKNYIGDGYLHDGNEAKGKKTLTFLPELPRAGRYEVRFAYTPGDNRADKVPLTVFSADGEKTITVNEKDPPPIEGRFVSLGTYKFELNGQGFVIAANEGTQGHVIADAVQFLPADDMPPPTATAVKKPDPDDDDSDAKALTDEIRQLEQELAKLDASGPKRPMVMTVVEEKDISDTYVHIRGSVHNRGETAPRGFLQVATTSSLPPFSNKQSGRRELAEWIARPDNPLTARVMVNRAWHWLFGAGLVRTADNFGTTGERPSHPELLDFLAARFMGSGWSVKSLVREIVCSRAYRQTSALKATAAAVDPENRLLARMNRRRLEAECLRDAMLLADGSLDGRQGGRTFGFDLAADYGFADAGTRRSVYVPVFRNALPEMFEAFDFADSSVVTGVRNTSTVATQALFLMNNPFVLERSRRLAERLLRDHADNPTRARQAFLRILGREPTSSEGETSLRFIGEEGRIDRWTQLAQTLFASVDFRFLE